MQVVSVEDIEKLILYFLTDRRKLKKPAFLVLSKTASLFLLLLKIEVIKDKLRHPEADRIMVLRHDFRQVVVQEVIRHTHLHLIERIGDLAHTSLEKIRMVADFPELHDEVHEVIHLSFIIS